MGKRKAAPEWIGLNDPVTEYALRVTAGDIVAGPYVRAACKRHLNDLKTGPKRGLRWDLPAALHVIGFFRDCLTVEVEERDEFGDIVSRAIPFELVLWQAFIIGSLFGWKNAQGLRRFRRAYVEIGKGNGKSPMAAGIGHYMLAAQRKLRPEIYAAATDLNQADILFQDAVAMRHRSPALARRVGTVGEKKILRMTTAVGGQFKPISSEKEGKSGFRVFCALLDEIHEHADNTVIEMMRAGTKGNQEALIFEITNSGFDKKTVCGQEHDYTVQVVEGTLPNDAWFGFITALDGARTEFYDIDEAIQILDDCCTCNAKTTLTEKPIAEAFVRLATSVIGAPVTSPKASDAQFTQADKLLRGAFATLATDLGLAQPTLSSGQLESKAKVNGNPQTDHAPTPTRNAGETKTGEKIQAEHAPDSGSKNTVSQRKKFAASPPFSAADVVAAGKKLPISGWITATIPALFAGCSATSAIRELACSEIVNRAWNAHSPTCAIHQHCEVQTGRLGRKMAADDPFKDESCWIKANPNLGISIFPEYIREQVNEARGMPSKEGLVRRLNFCQWTESENCAIPRATWEACQGKVNPDALLKAGYPCFGGLDLSRVKDLTAFTLTWLLDQTKDKQKFASFTWFWTPKDTLAERQKTDKAPYEAWVKAGFMEAVPGNRISYPWVADALGTLCAKYDPVTIGCDQYGLEQMRDHALTAGIDLPCEVHPQGFNRRVVDKTEGHDPETKKTGVEEIALWMPDSINKLEAALLDRRITVPDNPVMAMCAASVVYSENRTGARMFDKSKATKRIDGMVSLAMSIGMATLERPVSQAEQLRRAIAERGGFA